MGRHKLGIAGAVVVLLALAWLWPEGGAPAGAPDATEPTSSPSPAPPSGGEGEVGATGSPSPSVSPSVVAEPPEAEPAVNTYDGPLGTRNHSGSEAVALTFDDGPSPEWTPRVLDLLRERGVKATFCVIGAYAEAYPELVADIAREGHTLCNHSWFHEFDLGVGTTEEIRANLQRTNDAIVRAAPGARVEYFRHPGGRWTERAVAVAAAMGMESLHWTVDPSDWDVSSSAAQIRDRVLERSAPGAIVLLHDGASNQEAMCEALEAIFAEFARRGYSYSRL